jgi:hypothetical protein
MVVQPVASYFIPCILRCAFKVSPTANCVSVFEGPRVRFSDMCAVVLSFLRVQVFQVLRNMTNIRETPFHFTPEDESFHVAWFLFIGCF